MEVAAPTAVSHRPPQGNPNRNPRRLPVDNTHKQVSLISMHTMKIRAATQQIDRIAPGLLAGHLERLYATVREAEKMIDDEIEIIEKFDRARNTRRGAIRGSDSAELRSIEDGGNG